MPNLSDIGAIRALLNRYDFTFSKSLGQNFLVNASVCPRMAQACAESHNEGVIEIGPGIGGLRSAFARSFATSWTAVFCPFWTRRLQIMTT